MIRCLNLDPEFVPVPKPEIEYRWINFPAGERQIRLNMNIDYKKVDKVIITARYSKHVGDRILMDIALAYDALYRQGVHAFEFILPYFPHSRQDRVTVAGESFSLTMFSALLDAIPHHRRDLKSIHTFDMHSLRGEDIANCTSKNNHEFVRWVMKNLPSNQKPILIIPDRGAIPKGEALYKENPSLFETVSYCGKRRDPKTGRLSGFEAGHPDYLGKPCIIIDDICDGGGTFIGLAQELRRKNAGTLYLAVSHGIFSKGFGNLIGYPFHRIYTTNSYKRTPKTQKLMDNLVTKYPYLIHEYKLQW